MAVGVGSEGGLPWRVGKQKPGVGGPALPSLPGQILLGCGPRGCTSCCVLLSCRLPSRASLRPPLHPLQGLMALPGAPSSGVTKHLSLPGPAPCSPLEPPLPCMDGCSCFPLPGKAISARCPCQARARPPQAPGPVGSSPWSTAQRTLLLSSLHLCGHHKVPPDTSHCPHIPRSLTTGDSGRSCRTQPHPGAHPQASKVACARCRSAQSRRQ